jgi:hypothetical protein
LACRGQTRVASHKQYKFASFRQDAALEPIVNVSVSKQRRRKWIKKSLNAIVVAGWWINLPGSS